MKAEIIAVGSEMLTPDHVDTNSLFLTDRLNDAGFRVHLKTVVGDDEGEIAEVLQAALQRSDLIIFSGGLGPTEDDLTRAAVAGVLGRKLSIRQDLLEALRVRFASRGYRMPSINERQAQVIEEAEILENSLGTAPGMWIEQKNVRIALLPGPPRELRSMFESQVLPRASRLGKGLRLAKRVLHVTGMTESEVDSQAAPIYKSYPGVQTIILASPGHITLKLSRWVEPGENPTDLDELAQAIGRALGRAVFSTTGEQLEEVVGRMLSESGRSVAVAESCTAGMLGMRITRVPGSSRYFLGGVVCYSNDAKRKLCDVSPDLLRDDGAVSPQVATALAQGVRKALGSSIGLSITGIAGPGGGTEQKPIGLVFVGLCDEGRSEHFKRIIPGDRETVRERTTYFALSKLRDFLS